MSDGLSEGGGSLSLARSPVFVALCALLVVGLVISKCFKNTCDWYYNGHRRRKGYRYQHAGYSRPIPGEKSKWQKVSEFKTPSGVTLASYTTSPCGSARAVYIFVHPFGIHMGYYAHLGEKLASDGIEVSAIDLGGFGKSEGPRGYVAHQNLIRDVTAFAEKIKKERKLPIYIGGLGMGALVATCCAHENPGLFEGLTVLSPLDLEVKGCVYRLCVAVFSRIAPCIRVCGSRKLDAHSRNLAVAQTLKFDNLVNNVRKTWKAEEELRRLSQRVHRLLPKLSVPLVYIQGLEDLLADPKASITWSQSTTSLTPNQKEMMLLKSGWHNLLLEPEVDHVIDKVATFISSDLDFRFLKLTLD